MKAGAYTLVSQDGSDVDEKDYAHPIIRPSLSIRWKSLLIAISAFLLASIGINVYLIYRQYFKPWQLYDELPSKYAHLRFNVPTEIVSHTAFDNTNRTIQDAAWNDRDVEPWNSFVALDEDYTIAQGLPHSQRWPWDLNKGVYILTAAHELHCTRVLRTVINEFHDLTPLASQTWGYGHTLHCLNVLRESVMCHADDTPLYIGRLHKNVLEKGEPKAGIGSYKMCRDWNQLLSWSRERSACYRPINWGMKGEDEIERYKFCPGEKRPWEGVEGEYEGE